MSYQQDAFSVRLHWGWHAARIHMERVKAAGKKI